MKKAFLHLMITALALAACAAPPQTGTHGPSPDQLGTVVAATLRALPTQTPASLPPQPPAELLPRTLYFLSNDGVFRRDDGTLLMQVYRMERDGKGMTRLTDEPNGVDGYDVSTVDGTVAFIADNQLVLVNADGSNRRALVDGGAARLENNPSFYKDPVSHPVFSPDGRTIAYARNGLSLYDLSSGATTLAIEDKYSEPMPDGVRIRYEYYSPARYSPGGTKLLVAQGGWEAPPIYAVYDPSTDAIVRPTKAERDFCCGGPVWSPDGSSFYGVALIPQYAFRTGEIWRVDASSGDVTVLFPFDPNNERLVSPNAPHLSPDGNLSYFFGDYRADSGYFEPPVLYLVRSASDGVTGRTVLRDDNFVLMNEALWAPDASFVIVATAPSRNLADAGVLELYSTEERAAPLWLAPFGKEMKWGP